MSLLQVKDLNIEFHDHIIPETVVYDPAADRLSVVVLQNTVGNQDVVQRFVKVKIVLAVPGLRIQTVHQPYRPLNRLGRLWAEILHRLKCVIRCGLAVTNKLFGVFAAYRAAFTTPRNAVCILLASWIQRDHILGNRFHSRPPFYAKRARAAPGKRVVLALSSKNILL